MFMYIYVLLGSQWSSIHSSDMLSGFDSLYLAELSCVLLWTHLLQLLNQLYFRCSHCLTFQSMFNQLFFFFNRFLGLKITTLLCTVLNRCVFIKCFVFFYFLYLVNWNIKYHLGCSCLRRLRRLNLRQVGLHLLKFISSAWNTRLPQRFSQNFLI